MPDAPVKSSANTRVQPVGVGGTAAVASKAVSRAAAPSTAADPAAVSARTARLGIAGDGPALWGCVEALIVAFLEMRPKPRSGARSDRKPADLADFRKVRYKGERALSQTNKRETFLEHIGHPA